MSELNHIKCYRKVEKEGSLTHISCYRRVTWKRRHDHESTFQARVPGNDRLAVQERLQERKERHPQRVLPYLRLSPQARHPASTRLPTFHATLGPETGPEAALPKRSDPEAAEGHLAGRQLALLQAPEGDFASVAARLRADQWPLA